MSFSQIHKNPILFHIRADAGQRSSPESGFANKTKIFSEQKIKEEKSLDGEIYVTVT